MIELSIPEINDLMELLKKERIKASKRYNMDEFRNKWSMEGRINIILDKLQAELNRIDSDLKASLKH